MKSRTVLILALGAQLLAFPPATHAQAGLTSPMDKVYMDESHCLTAADIRSDNDNGVSCFCRDAIADARYVYFTCVLSGKDWNLKGIFLDLQRNAADKCSRNSAEADDMGFISKIDSATESKD